jgi:hypothetical protein
MSSLCVCAARVGFGTTSIRGLTYPWQGLAEPATDQARETGRIVQVPQVGGLHHRYEHRAG